jgi:hypothetical protein
VSKSVWVIEQGSYSDYHVAGVFSSRKNAEIVLASLAQDNSESSIAEWPLDPAIKEINAGLTVWVGEMLRDGTVERCVTGENSGYNLQNDLSIWRRASVPAYKGTGIEDCLHGTVWAKDQKHAVKIFNEKRTELIATNKWQP